MRTEKLDGMVVCREWSVLYEFLALFWDGISRYTFSLHDPRLSTCMSVGDFLKDWYLNMKPTMLNLKAMV